MSTPRAITVAARIPNTPISDVPVRASVLSVALSCVDVDAELLELLAEGDPDPAEPLEGLDELEEGDDATT
jgi:hypothetical protein